MEVPALLVKLFNARHAELQCIVGATQHSTLNTQHSTLNTNLENFFDLHNPSSWEAIISCKPKTVILLSWPGLQDLQGDFHITRNLPAYVQLVDQLIAAGLERIVVAGTCYEYGLQNGMLKEDQPTDPVNPYAIAKDLARRAVATLCDYHEASWSWLRIFFAYGEGQNPKSLLPSLERAIQQGEATFTISSGSQLRDFIAVEDVADQLLLLATHPKAFGIYNGGSGEPQSLRKVVQTRIAALRSEIQIKENDHTDRLDEPIAFWADMSRLQELKHTRKSINPMHICSPAHNRELDEY